MNVQRLRIAPWLALFFACSVAACALLVGNVDGHRLFEADGGAAADATPIDALVPTGDDSPDEAGEPPDAPDTAIGDENTSGDRDALLEAGPDAATPYGGVPIVLAARERRPTGIVATQTALYWVDSDNLTLRQIARESDGRFPAMLADGGTSATTATSMAGQATTVSDLVTDGQALYVLSSGGNCFLYMSAPLPITGGFTCYYPDGLCKVTRMATDYASPASLVLDVMVQPGWPATTTPDCPAMSFPSVLFQSAPSQNPSQNSGWHNVGTIAAGSPQGLAANAQSVFYGVPSTTGGAVLYMQSRTAPFAAKALGLSTGSTVNDVAVDSTSVYWADNAGYIYAAPINAASPYQSLTSQSVSPAPGRLALDDANVYWVSATGNPSTTGFVGMVSKHGGAVIKLATNLNQPYALAVDANGLYWTNQGDGTVMMLLPNP